MDIFELPELFCVVAHYACDEILPLAVGYAALDLMPEEYHRDPVAFFKVDENSNIYRQIVTPRSGKDEQKAKDATQLLVRVCESVRAFSVLRTVSVSFHRMLESTAPARIAQVIEPYVRLAVVNGALGGRVKGFATEVGYPMVKFLLVQDYSLTMPEKMRLFGIFFTMIRDLERKKPRLIRLTDDDRASPTWSTSAELHLMNYGIHLNMYMRRCSVLNTRDQLMRRLLQLCKERAARGNPLPIVTQETESRRIWLAVGAPVLLHDITVNGSFDTYSWKPFLIWENPPSRDATVLNTDTLIRLTYESQMTAELVKHEIRMLAVKYGCI